MCEGVHIGEHVLLVIHQDIRRRAVAARGKCAAAFAFAFVTIAPPARAQTFGQHIDVFFSKEAERVQHRFDRLIKGKARLDFGN